MRDDPEQPEQHPGSSTNDDKPDARSSPDRAADQAPEDAERTALDADQTLSDANQTLSDADQSGAETDQARSDADQRASDRDQLASDHDRATHASTDATFLDIFAASRAERERGTAERKAATATRSLTMFKRAEHAARRDEQATLRDIQAAALDITAEVRDRAAEADERASGQGGASASEVRVTAAADRARAAKDRARAAEDRQQAALDRAHARIELEKSQLDDLTGFYRLGLGRVVMQREIDRSRRSGGRLVLAYCDVDGLKRVNDEEGHGAGDALLKSLAAAIRSRLRSYDPVVRVGGDEFVFALSEVDLEQAGRILQDIQGALASRRRDASMSFGLAGLRADDSLATLMERSDLALRETRSALL